MGDLSIFDNDLTTAYKAAKRHNTPVRLLVLNENYSGPPNSLSIDMFEMLSTLIKRHISSATARDIYRRAYDLSPALILEDFVMLYSYWRFRLQVRVDHIVNDINTVYQEVLEADRYNSQDDLVVHIKTWQEGLMKAMAEDLAKHDKIVQIQAQLTNIKPLKISEFSRTHTTIAFSPNYRGEPVTLEDGIDIFNEAKVSIVCSFIRFNGNTTTYSKIWGENYSNDEIDYTGLTRVKKKEYSTPDTIHATIWVGKGSLAKYLHSDLVHLDYNLESNYMTVEVPNKRNVTSEQIAEIVRVTFPGLDLGPALDASLGGSFTIEGADINKPSFFHMLLVQPLFSTYLYIEESTKPAAFKKKLDLHYLSLFVEEGHETKQQREGYIANPASLSCKIVSEPGMLTLSVYRSESMVVVKEFMNVTSRLFSYYMENREGLDRQYRAMTPNLYSQSNIPRELPSVSVESKSRLKYLQTIAPDLFPKGYSTKCQGKKKQPLIAYGAELEKWRTTPFTIAGKTYHTRQLMPFPKDNPRYYFVCTSDQFPFPGVKINTDLPNRDKYPYIPCCFSTDQMDPTANSYYNEYYRGIPKASSKGGDKKRTHTLLGLGGIGHVTHTITEMLLNVYRTGDVRRLGMMDSPNSLIHCLCYATNYDGYLSLLSDELREKKVLAVRSSLASYVHTECLRQELYDATPEKIQELLNGTDYFDYDTLYRALEEFFDINIYAFTSKVNAEKVEVTRMRVPRHQLFHLRSIRTNRRTLILWMRSMSRLGYPQVDIIYVTQGNDIRMVLHDQTVTKLLHRFLSETQRLYMWEVDRGQLTVYSNFLLSLGASSIASLSPSAQYIDNKGKARALVLDIDADQKMTIVVPPMQPENIPSITLSQLPRVPGALSRKLLGQPHSGSRSNGMTDGYWYKVLGKDEGIYIPITPETSELPEGTANPLGSLGTDPVARVAAIKRASSILMQLVQWCYLLYPGESEGFISSYIGDPATGVSSSIYDFSRLKRRLPILDSIESAIVYISTHSPNMISGGKFVMYNAELHRRVTNKIQRYAREVDGNKKAFLKRYLSDYYTNREGFNVPSNILLFMSLSELSYWLAEAKKEPATIVRTLDIAMLNNQEPIIYEQGTSKYLIQNVIGGSDKRALMVTQTWIGLRKNLGFSAPEIDPKDIKPWAIYEFSPAGTLVPTRDHTNGGDIYSELLEYPITIKQGGRETRKYAALLPLS